VTGQRYSLGPPVFSTNKTDPHDIAEILLKVALENINEYMERSCKGDGADLPLDLNTEHDYQ
jgi:hypothetical protein